MQPKQSLVQHSKVTSFLVLLWKSLSLSAHTVIELAVGLLTVDDVEAVGGSGPHTAHLEVEPLLVLRAIHISIDQ